MKKITLIVIFLIVVAFGGKFGLEYYYESKLDKMIKLVSSIGDIQHKGVSIGFDGSISIKKLSVRPYTVDTTVSLDELTLFSSDRLLPLKLAKMFENKDFPESIGLKVNNLEYSPTVFMPKVDDKNECRYVETPINYSSLGVRRLNSNILMSVDTSNKLDSVLEMTSIDQTTNTKLKLTFDATRINANLINSDNLPINEFQLDYKIDESIADKMISYCAKKLKLSTDDYLNKVIGTANYTRILGLDLGPDAHKALVDVMQGNKWLSIKSTPSSQIKSLSSAKFYQPKDIVRLMNLSLKVDNDEINLDATELKRSQPVENVVSNEAIETETVSSSDNQNTDSIESNELTEDQIRAQQKQSITEAEKTFDYKTTPINTLNKYINYNIKVKRNGNKRMLSGILTDIEGDTFSIETTQYSGIAVFKVNKSDVVELLVYR